MPLTLKPTTPAMLGDMLRFLVGEKARIEIRGSGSKLAIGRPVEADYRVELAGMAGIELYEPEELVLSALAGTRIAHIEAALSNHRQMLAFEPPDLGPLLGGPAGGGTLGGMLAANFGGPRRVRAGSPRDHFLGLKATSGRGEPFKAGGRVVKNVTGYDLCKLVAGSWGTLAAVAEATIKVLPAPETSATVMLRGLDTAAAVAAMTAALNSPHEVSGAAHLPAGIARGSGIAAVSGAGDAVTLLRLEGFEPSVAARREALAALLDRFGETATLDAAASAAGWREVRDAAPFASGDGAAGPPVWRVSLPPAAAAAFLADATAGLDARWYLDWGGGLAWIEVTGAPDCGQAAIRPAVKAAGGHAMLVRAGAEDRARLDVFEPPAPGVAALQRRVKEGFDPLGLLNPGRMYREG